MSTPDFNLLLTLDAVLTEGSVARAAKRLGLSPSAMSRALARLRETTGDPLLVRAGRGLVPTPRALELREKVSQIVQDAEAVLRPTENLNLKQLERTFTIRTREGFVENFGPGLLVRVAEEAPGVRLCFVQKLDKDSVLLRNGTVDLETGIVGPLSKGEITPASYASGKHIGVSLRGNEKGLIDEALSLLNLERDVATIVGGFSTALALTRATDMIASVPERHTGNLRAGMFSFPLPITMPEFTVSLLWHPRFHADPAHRWLRGLVLDACASFR
ncbi:MAG: LysR family transcriptional regulator [Burkholderiales bacterium]|nr:LysR family transcriptional regulator [Burkholderiales bacterium]